MEIEQHHLRLTERGFPAILEEDAWLGVEQDENWRLFESLAVVRSQVHAGHRLIEPRQFVGHFKARYWSVRVEPRYPEFFRALCTFVGQWAAREAPSVERAREFPEQTGPLDAETAFFVAINKAIDSGLPCVYSKRTVTTAGPRGRVRFAETIRQLQSRGIRYKVVCEEPVRYGDPRLRGVVGTAMAVLWDRLLPQSAQRRTLELISEVVEPTVLRIGDAIEVAGQIVAEYSDWPDVVLLALICRTILRSADDVWDVQQQLDIGECRFCNVDRLWEVGVYRAVEQATLKPGLNSEYHPFRRAKVRLFDSGGPEIDPDVVVFDHGRPNIVVDAKYSVKREPDAGDVYQIACYASKLKSPTGVLVYLAEPNSPWFAKLGQAADGTAYFAAGVALNSVAGGLATTAARIAMEAAALAPAS